MKNNVMKSQHCISLVSVIFLLILLPHFIWSQEVEFISQVDLSAEGNDIWGYTDKDGKEYVLIGSRVETSIFDISQPQSPKLIDRIPGAKSIWRDIKTYKDHAYVTTDWENDGLLSIDLSMLPDSVSYHFYKPFITTRTDRESQLGSCHNLYIDDGYAYLAGCLSVGRGGVIIFDLNQDPVEPPFVGIADRFSSHDAFVNNNLLFSSETNRGQVGIYDVTVKSNPTLLTSVPTTGNFTHNVWTDENNHYMYTTDEIRNGSVNIFDISDLDNTAYLGQFRTENSKGNEAIPHNVHYKDGFLVTSWYSEGLIILDAHRPENIVQVGQYDTYQGPHGGFNGNWGAFPYFDSGLVALSDIQSGLIIVKPTYKRASYLEVTFENSDTGSPIKNVDVEITSDSIKTTSLNTIDGSLKTGFVYEGELPMRFSVYGYFPIDTVITMASGEVAGGIIKLKPRQSKSLAFDVRNAQTGESISDFYLSSLSSLNANRNEQHGKNDVNVYEGESLNIAIGKWGYKTYYNTVNFENNTMIQVLLEPSIEDDFEFQYGWTSVGMSSSNWTRATPTKQDESNSNGNSVYIPETDSPGDSNFICYTLYDINQSNTNPGASILTSPPLDFSAHDPAKTELEIEYDLWYTISNEEKDQVFLDITMISQNDTILIERIDSTISFGNQWSQSRQFYIDLDKFKQNDSIYIQITSVNDASNTIVGAGFDHFYIRPVLKTSTSEVEEAIEPNFYPNPVSDRLYFEKSDFEGDVLLYNSFGQMVLKGSIQLINDQLNTLTEGTYFIQYKLYGGAAFTIEKLIKH